MDQTLVKFSENIALQTSSKPNPSILESIIINHKNTKVPLRKIAQVSVRDAQTFIVNVADEQLLSVVDSAIRNSNLGLNPQKGEYGLVVPFPNEKKEAYIKLIKKSAELTKANIRNARQTARGELKKYARTTKMTSDDEKKHDKEVATDKCVEKVDKIAQAKEKELK